MGKDKTSSAVSTEETKPVAETPEIACPAAESKADAKIKKKRFPRLWKWVKRVAVVMAIPAIILLGIDRYVVETTRADVCSIDSLPTEPADAILVLGAQVYPDGRLCDMLADRMRVGISLYQAGAAKILLLSGDGQTDDYNEPEAMKQYALAQGVPEDAIVLDRAGLCTYDSVYRARTVNGYDSLIVVSQTYHLYRALYIADAVGVDAIGVSADLQFYWGQTKREVREVLARNKDFWLTML